MPIKLDDNFKKAVETKNISLSQSSVIRLMSKDRRLENFETPTFAKYANDNLDKFWIEDDGETEFPSKDKWDIDLWKIMCAEIGDNFSKKKFDFIIEIMHHLRDEGHPDFQAKTKNNSQTKASVSDSSSEVKSNNSNKNTIALACIGGVVGLIGGAIIGKKIIGTIVGTVIGAAIGYKKDN